MKKDKSALMVAYYFPPYANVSTVRTTKYCKYLSKFGWVPKVLTVNEKYYQDRVLPLDSFNMGELAVSKVPYIPIPLNVVFIKLFFPIIVFLYIFKNRKDIDIIYFSGSPFHPFLLTVVIDFFLKKPTVLDFRDSWSINHGYDGQTANSWRSKVKQWFTGKIEKYAIKFSSSVIFATPVLKQEYEELYPDYKHKYETILNGYDPDDFLGIEPITVTKKTTLVLAGQFNIYTPTAVIALMRALKNLPELHFIYMGNEADLISKLAKSYSVEESVSVFPYLPYEDVLRYVAGANYALLSNGLKNGMGTKIFDYLALNKAILCLVPEGSVIKQQFSGLESILIAEPPYTVELLTNKLSELLQLSKTKNGSLAVSEFSRIEATKKLTEIFDEAVTL